MRLHTSCPHGRRLRQLALLLDAARAVLGSCLAAPDWVRPRRSRAARNWSGVMRPTIPLPRSAARSTNTQRSQHGHRCGVSAHRPAPAISLSPVTVAVRREWQRAARWCVLAAAGCRGKSLLGVHNIKAPATRGGADGGTGGSVSLRTERIIREVGAQCPGWAVQTSIHSSAAGPSATAIKMNNMVAKSVSRCTALQSSGPFRSIEHKGIIREMLGGHLLCARHHRERIDLSTRDVGLRVWNRPSSDASDDQSGDAGCEQSGLMGHLNSPVRL